MSAAGVVVTGGSTGIGRAVAARAAARGDDVFLIDVDAEGVAATAEQLGAAG